MSRPDRSRWRWWLVPLVIVGGWTLLALAYAVIVGVSRLGTGVHAQRLIRDVLCVLVLLVLLAVGRALLGRRGSAAALARRTRRSNRRGGVASGWDLFKTGSRFAVRRRMGVLRPSLGRLPWWRRMFVSTYEIATPLAQVGRRTVWSPVEDVTLRLGGPRVGKSGELACRILDAPGAVIATSTRTDLLDWTGPLRSRRGPVWVFNPSGVGDRLSTVTFDPLTGCTVPKTAYERASDLIAGAETGGGSDPRGEREYWTAQATRVLTALLHAAALGGASMRDVHGWLSAPDEHAADIQRCLRASSEPAFETDLAQFVRTNDRTRSSITTTIMPALAWLHDPAAARAAGQTVGRAPVLDSTGVTIPDDGCPQWDPPGLDVEALLDRSGTVYLLGAQDAQVAPLVTALTGHLARTARAIANRQPSGRLDPPLTLCLDEVALICPIPLDEWTADMGGRNITIHLACQSQPQLRKRWGVDGAAAILNNAATVLIFGGTRDADDLAAYSTLLGERNESVPSYDRAGRLLSATTTRVPVLPPALIAQLGQGEVVVIHRGMPPALGTVGMVWRRRDVRAEQRRRRRERAAAVHRFRTRFEARNTLRGRVLEARVDAAGETLDRRLDAAADAVRRAAVRGYRASLRGLRAATTAISATGRRERELEHAGEVARLERLLHLVPPASHRDAEPDEPTGPGQR